MSQSNFTNDRPPFQVQPAPCVGQLNLNQCAVARRRSEVGAAGLSRLSRFRFLSTRIYFHSRRPRKEFTSGPYAHLYEGSQDVRHAVPRVERHENSSLNLPTDPIPRPASQLESNTDSVNSPSVCEYIRRASNPIHIRIVRQKADPNSNHTGSCQLLSSYVMRTKRLLHRSLGPYERLSSSNDNPSDEPFAGSMEMPDGSQISGSSPQTTTTSQNFIDLNDNPSGLEETVRSASDPPNNTEDKAMGDVATNPDQGNGKTAVEKEAAGPSAILPFTWV